MFKGILNAMNSIHILLSLLLVHIVTAQSWHGFGDSLDHSHNKRSPPAPGGDGICYTHIVQENDTCAKLSKHYQITTSNIETWNLGSWDWPGCAKLKQGNFICLSSGALPMPVALPHAVCGPQVPGTRRPAKYSNLASLNPCPSNQCCSKLGQCGTRSDFCDASTSCIFNCGPKSTQNKATTKSTMSKTTAAKANTSKTTTSKTTTSRTTTSKANTSKATTSKTTTTPKATTPFKATTKDVMVTLTSIKLVQAPSKTTTSAASTQTWQMSFYSKDKCEGDYFTVQGHEDQHSARCIVLADDTNTKISDSTTSCRWWSDEGLNWGTCSSGKLKKPKSWFIKSGKCSMFSGKKCEDADWVGETYAPFKGCQSGNTGFMSPAKGKTWGAVQCYEMKSQVVEQ
ncbi:hypothetical protein ACN38_g4228 [Penicillium nordicum]|uniref:LysM domain-containing protein n=1 Tax=Penicillium nordicum TaxID=229535 RepID=A0A0M8P3T3_9EURO|nr:hypothetical protein ACN38_g4228 [Penicillium nordicum]